MMNAQWASNELIRVLVALSIDRTKLPLRPSIGTGESSLHEAWWALSRFTYDEPRSIDLIRDLEAFFASEPRILVAGTATIGRAEAVTLELGGVDRIPSSELVYRCPVRPAGPVHAVLLFDYATIASVIVPSLHQVPQRRGVFALGYWGSCGPSRLGEREVPVVVVTRAAPGQACQPGGSRWCVYVDPSSDKSVLIEAVRTCASGQPSPLRNQMPRHLPET